MLAVALPSSFGFRLPTPHRASRSRPLGSVSEFEERARQATLEKLDAVAKFGSKFDHPVFTPPELPSLPLFALPDATGLASFVEGVVGGGQHAGVAGAAQSVAAFVDQLPPQAPVPALLW